MRPGMTLLEVTMLDGHRLVVSAGQLAGVRETAQGAELLLRSGATLATRDAFESVCRRWVQGEVGPSAPWDRVRDGIALGLLEAALAARRVQERAEQMATAAVDGVATAGAWVGSRLARAIAVAAAALVAAEEFLRERLAVVGRTARRAERAASITGGTLQVALDKAQERLGREQYEHQLMRWAVEGAADSRDRASRKRWAREYLAYLRHGGSSLRPPVRPWEPAPVPATPAVAGPPASPPPQGPPVAPPQRSSRKSTISLS